ncbi:phosphatase 2c [Anaeramoeba flamelloides]|uniref:Phosphatase 2c n=1 Tax=Anaeramoeba flamelloides TaxID=1746091 RepID=A0ABQ8XVL5_9EUKA|nr:phosphatase 2c [Anaeramoeba flamelloides]
MKSLCGLDLSSNKINNIYISFKELNSLTMLNLSDNKIKMLPKRFFLLNTTNKFSTLSIDLSFNKLTTFQQAWSKLMNLRSLDLSFNQISAFPSEIFKRLISLETLKIAQNNAKNLNLISFVKLNPNLLFLHLEGNEINEKFLKRLLELKPIKRNKQSKRKTLVKVNMKKYGNNNNNQNNNRVTQLMQILPNGMIQWNCYKNGLQEILIGGAVNSNSKTNKHINKKINNSKSNNYNDNNGNSNTSSSSGSSSNKYIHKINKKNASQICRKINICSKQFKIGYSETIGKRFDMEDAIDINTEFSLKDSLSLFALYDGHSGRGSVNSVSHQFSKIFFEQLYSRSRSRIKSKSRNNSISKIIPTSNKSNRLSRSISDDRKATIFISQKQNINYQKIKIITSSSSNNSISSSLSCSSKISKNKNNKKINKQNSTNIEAEDDNDGHTQFNSHNSTSNKQKFKKKSQQISNHNHNNNNSLPKNSIYQHKNLSKYIYKIFKKSFKIMNSKLLKQKETSGSTAVVVLIGKTNIFCANAGDSRAVLFRGGKAIRLSFDHKPYLPEERKRIKQSGGFVSENFRVNSGIAVSRGFGDYKFRNQLTCNPYFSSLERNENEDQFIILACDGVWDVLTDDQAVGIVWKSKNVESAAIKIRNYATVQQSTDNISVIVIDLQPNVSLKERAKQLLKNNSFQSNSKTNLPHNPFDHVSSLANTTNLTKSNSINQSNLNRSNNSSDSNSNDKKHEQSQYNNTVHSDQNNEVGNGNDKEIQSTKSNKSNMKNFKKKLKIHKPYKSEPLLFNNTQISQNQIKNKLISKQNSQVNNLSELIQFKENNFINQNINIIFPLKSTQNGWFELKESNAEELIELMKLEL